MGFCTQGFLVEDVYISLAYILTFYIQVILFKNSGLIKNRSTYARNISSINIIKSLKIYLRFFSNAYIKNVSSKDACVKNICVENNCITNIYVRNTFIKNLYNINIVKSLKII